MFKRLAVMFFAMGLPMYALAAPRTFVEFTDLITNLINAGIGIALILGIVIYFYGISTSLVKTGKGEVDHMRAHLVWGLIALFVMFSVWGILALLRNTLFSGGGGFSGGSYNNEDPTCLSVDCVVGEK